MLGVSVLGFFRHLLTQWGAPWYIWFLAPIVLVTLLAKKESEWLPDPEKRRKWSRWLVYGSILLVLAISWFAPKKPVEPSMTEPVGRARVRGQ